MNTMILASGLPAHDVLAYVAVIVGVAAVVLATAVAIATRMVLHRIDDEEHLYRELLDYVRHQQGGPRST